MDLLGVVALGTVASALWISWRYFAPVYLSPITRLPGPPCPSLLYGNFRQISNVRNSLIMRDWAEKYGPNCLIRWFLQTPSLWTIDPVTVGHIMSHSYNYEKPMEGRRTTARLIGQSIIIAEGDNPAFGPAQIREFNAIFVEKSAQLRDVWSAQIVEKGGCLQTNVMDGLRSLTLDVIGLAGFNYHFDSLNPDKEPNELSKAFEQIFKRPPSMSILRVLLDVVPVLNVFPDERTRKIKEGRVMAGRIGMQLIKEKKAAILSESSAGVEKKDIQGRDILTLLLKANLATDIPDNQRISDDEVLAQIGSLLAAGHETTNTATAWCLYALSLSPRIQRKLRQELLQVSTEPTMEALAELPYLDAVIRETLRVYAPVTTSLRVAVQDDVLPISEPFVDRNGLVQNQIRITKGNKVVMPIDGMNQSKALWGDDSLEFRPERWESPPEAITNIPGVWGHILTFFGGARGCIGYRFAVTEMKVIIFTLVRSFEFELAVPRKDAQPTGTFLQRPALVSEPERGTQLPMFIRAYVHE
ncbi:cytochrome P450 [Fomes fomentarius]|nr:cytochrome P450 [Fomes fomentarius]